MNTPTTLHDAFVMELRDTYDAEKQVLKALPKMVKAATERTKSGLNKAGAKIDDAWITTKVKWFMTGEDLLKGSDINVDTTKDVDGVTRVVDQLTIGG